MCRESLRISLTNLHEAITKSIHVQGITADLCDEPARGDHPHGGEGQVQEVPGGGEEAIQSRTAEVSLLHLRFRICTVAFQSFICLFVQCCSFSAFLIDLNCLYHSYSDALISSVLRI